jgi:hypothetical protein
MQQRLHFPTLRFAQPATPFSVWPWIVSLNARQHWFWLGAQSIFERVAAGRRDPDTASLDRLAVGLADRALCCRKPGVHKVS